MLKLSGHLATDRWILGIAGKPNQCFLRIFQQFRLSCKLGDWSIQEVGDGDISQNPGIRFSDGDSDKDVGSRHPFNGVPHLDRTACVGISKHNQW